MYQSFCERILFALLAKRLGIEVSGPTCINTLELKEYTIQVFNDLGILTVQQAIIAYCLHHDTPGIGKGSWDDFLNAVTR